MKKIILTVSLLLIGSAAALADKPVSLEQLPAAAQSFLKSHFPSQAVTFASEDRGLISKEYEVLLSDGAKVDFDSDGEWTDVECKLSRVPDAIVPKPITEYVAKSFPQVKILKIERDRRGYELSLSNGLDIDFDKQFKVVDIDD